ncbi:MAG: hypothetical protein M3R68_01120 [Acidobacteriota bacterium]|nr:hypothetical protein [Acidobacteriota bacterium]
MRRSTSVNSQVIAYLLDDQGEVNGLLLTSGDQLHFSKQTGAVVAAQIKVGDQVTANGHAGSKSSYGREVRVEQISANGHTIVEAEAAHPRPHGPRAERGPGDRDDRGGRRGPPDPRAEREGQPPVGSEAQPADQSRAPGSDPNATPNTNGTPVASSLPEVFKAAGTIRTHLVNGHGDVDGLVLSNGEQVRFSPRVGSLIVAAEQGATTQVSVEGNGIRNERGTVIRPTQITVGNQTIALGH